MTTYEFIILQRNSKEKSQIKISHSPKNPRQKPIIKIEQQCPKYNHFLNLNPNRKLNFLFIKNFYKIKKE